MKTTVFCWVFAYSEQNLQVFELLLICHGFASLYKYFGVVPRVEEKVKLSGERDLKVTGYLDMSGAP